MFFLFNKMNILQFGPSYIGLKGNNVKYPQRRGKWFNAAKKIAEFVERASWRGDNKFGQHMAEWRLNKDGIIFENNE